MWFRSAVLVLVLLWTAMGASASGVAVLEQQALPEAVEWHAPGVGRVPSGAPEPGGPDPSAPVGLVAYSTPDGVRLEWQAPLYGSPTAYRVYRAVDAGPAQLIAEVPVTEYVDAEVFWNDVHLLGYHVTAVYGPAPGTESHASNQAFVATGPLQCYLVVVNPWTAPDVEFWVNDRYVDCLLTGQE